MLAKEGIHMKPVIGLIPLVDDEKESLWMLPGYMDGVVCAGGVPIMLPLTDNAPDLAQLCGMCDAFLLTGGHDVSPELYGEAPLPACGACSAARDRMEKYVLNCALQGDKPVLGICRGVQLLNALLGGTLYQDLPTQHPSATEHHQTPPYDVPVHEVLIQPDTPLHALLGRDRLPVNSYHHQAIKDLSPRLKPMAVSEDGLVEAVHLPGKRFVWGVQWHPEVSFRTDAASAAILRAFVGAAANSSI